MDFGIGNMNLHKMRDIRESVYIGHIYCNTAGKDVLFPFGYGLSHTSYEYKDMVLSAKSIKDSGELTCEKAQEAISGYNEKAIFRIKTNG